MSACDVGKDGYEYWGSVSVNSFRSQTPVDELRALTGSRSNRCFQYKMPPSEQCITQNYYVGTVNQTPGPVYKAEAAHNAAVRPAVKTQSFGRSERILSDSTQMHSGRLVNPSPAANEYNVLPSTTEKHLQASLATTNWKIRGLKNKKKSMSKMPMELRKSVERDYNDNYDTYVAKANRLQQQLDVIAGQKSKNVSTFEKKLAARKLPGFGSSGKREFQVSPPIQEAPTFYLSEANADFGTQSRAKTINMGAFNFTERADLLLEERSIRTRSVLTGLKIPPNRCRDTDFYGPLGGEHSKTPGVGSYHPPLFPANAFSGTFSTLALPGSRHSLTGGERGLDASFNSIPESFDGSRSSSRRFAKMEESLKPSQRQHGPP